MLLECKTIALTHTPKYEHLMSLSSTETFGWPLAQLVVSVHHQVILDKGLEVKLDHRLILPTPLPYLVKIPALVQHIPMRLRLFSFSIPLKHEHAYIRGTHDRLPQEINAVV